MIPSTAHFIWFGDAFPWLHALAIRSALEVGGFERAVLHHDSDLSGAKWWSEVAELPGFEARPLDPLAVLSAVDEIGPALAQIFSELDQPAARANMVRAAILWSEGGVYLDLDTVTIGAFDDLLLRDDFFCGEEPIAYPAHVKKSRNPAAWAGAVARDGVRDLLRRAPGGWRTFRRLEGLYTRAVNNAVVGCPPKHPFVERLLTAMTEVPVARRRVRFELGTALLQEQVAAWDAPGLTVYPPELFYPLGPEISQHWFREVEDPRPDEVVDPQTLVVHWYASVRTKEVVPRMDPDWIAAHRGSELFSALVHELPMEIAQG